ncbi:MAG: hypothetical protein M1834_008963 [Cirrosporium novae-zelandiae]|nr:MAG: hypothetical protein M1834_008963 [Cirrosporium novae-zelandiae]
MSSSTTPSSPQSHQTLADHSKTPPKQPPRHLLDLPQEIVDNIISFLRPAALCTLSQINHYFYRILSPKTKEFDCQQVAEYLRFRESWPKRTNNEQLICFACLRELPTSKFPDVHTCIVMRIGGPYNRVCNFCVNEYRCRGKYYLNGCAAMSCKICFQFKYGSQLEFNIPFDLWVCGACWNRQVQKVKSEGVVGGCRSEAICQLRRRLRDNGVYVGQDDYPASRSLPWPYCNSPPFQ